ncbi:hypothetical protein BH09BAC6_BH09BAC6_08830 [soil metagenome]
MKKFLLLFTFIIAISYVAPAQTKLVSTRRARLGPNMIVKDSAGVRYAFEDWQRLMMTGEYSLRSTGAVTDSTVFFIYKISEKEKAARNGHMQKPDESLFFTTGENIASFKANDINGNRIKISDLKGKVVVLNFWFIGCPPCRQEIPELNKIAAAYANNPDVVFIAIALDEKSDIKQFLKDNPFAYHIVADGRMYSNLYKINLYPTNVVLDKEGKVRFHASGLAPNTPYWISKTIEEVK